MVSSNFISCGEKTSQFCYVNCILYPIVTPFVVDESTLDTMDCLTFSLSQTCASEQSGNFVIQFQQGNGVCRDLHQTDFSTSTIQLMPRLACAPVASSTTNLCYRATLIYNGIIIDTQTNLNFNTCPESALSSFMGSGVSMQLNLDGEVTNGNVSHLTTTTLSCTSPFYELKSPQITCIDGNWEPAGLRSCTCKLHICVVYVEDCAKCFSAVAVWLIVVIILIILALACAIGSICGVLTARYLPSLLNGLVESK